MLVTTSNSPTSLPTKASAASGGLLAIRRVGDLFGLHRGLDTVMGLSD